MINAALIRHGNERKDQLYSNTLCYRPSRLSPKAAVQSKNAVCANIKR